MTVSTKRKQTLITATFCIILGIFFSYVMQQSPSPVLLEIRDAFGIVNNDSLLNLCVSAIYATIVAACLAGARIEKKIGLRRLFMATLLLMIFGGLLSLVSVHYGILIFSRLVWGFGFGLGIQFIGSAIMTYYSDAARVKMNTLNGMFPFLGTMLCFLLASKLSVLLGGFRRSLAVWTVPMIIAFLIWFLFVKEEYLPNHADVEEEEGSETGNVFKELWNYRPIRLLSITFICDFICYSYVAVILPTLFFEGTGLDLDQANLMAAFAFPACGIAGSGLGGILLSRTGLRKPTLVTGQILKLIGLLMATIRIGNPVLLILGICLFGIGNGLWMPAFYCVPMDLDGMTPNLAGAAFAFMSAFGMAAGFAAPFIGGYLTEVLRASSGMTGTAAHVYGLSRSLMLLGCMNIIALLCMVRCEETGRRLP